MILRDKDQTVNAITELDFFQIKSSLRTFLSQQDRFKDYNFDGSNMNVLLELLAYDTHYNAFYLNMLASEIRLSTTQRRFSAAANARGLGYLPRPFTCSRATLSLVLTTTEVPQPDEILIPEATRFTATHNGRSYVFTTNQTFVANKTLVDGVTKYVAGDIEVISGRRLKEKTIANDTNPYTVELKNPKVDYTTLKVSVRSTSSSNDDIGFTRLDQLENHVVSLDGSSKMYFLEELDALRYNLVFGDGVLGQRIENGNEITATYFISDGDETNGASVFLMDSTINNVTVETITTIIPAAGGGGAESVRSIKTNAPLLYQTQNRAATAIDYSAIILKEFGGIVRSVSSWGGEDNTPVALGYAFISAKPIGRKFLSEREKETIENTLKQKYRILTVTPIVVDPDYLYIRSYTTVKYDDRRLTTSPQALATAVVDKIVNGGFADELSSYNNYFRYSVLVSEVDSVSPAITNSVSVVFVEKRVDVETVTSDTYTINYYNSLIPNTLKSDPFDYEHEGIVYNNAILNDLNGIVYVNCVDSAGQPLLPTNTVNIGSINYGRGIISLPSFRVVLSDDSGKFGTTEEVRIFAEPAAYDVYGVRNTILIMDESSIIVKALRDSDGFATAIKNV